VETLELCDRILRDGAVRPLTAADRREILAASDALAREGLRILALAYRDASSMAQMTDYGAEKVEKQLIFIGFTASSDPVRPGVPEAVSACHQAGIRLIMITGDYPLTAESIGWQVGIGRFDETRPPVITGSEAMAMDDGALKTVLSSGEAIFARVAPDQKLRIVSLLKEIGEVVAVTGDGVNDGPALRCADIGIAMGLRGTDVAKEAAHMILGDDNFAIIVAAIEEGRAIFENIKRFVAYVLNSNPQEMYPYIFWMLFPETPLAPGHDGDGGSGRGRGHRSHPRHGPGDRAAGKGVDDAAAAASKRKAAFHGLHSARLFRPGHDPRPCLLRELFFLWLVHGLVGARRPAHGHAGLSRRTRHEHGDLRLPDEPYRLFLPYGDHPDRQCAVSAFLANIPFFHRFHRSRPTPGNP
jgi:phosphoserine phosphatase